LGQNLPLPSPPRSHTQLLILSQGPSLSTRSSAQVKDPVVEPSFTNPFNPCPKDRVGTDTGVLSVYILSGNQFETNGMTGFTPMAPLASPRFPASRAFEETSVSLPPSPERRGFDPLRLLFSSRISYPAPVLNGGSKGLLTTKLADYRNTATTLGNRENAI
jgi:hypothetical protein